MKVYKHEIIKETIECCIMQDRPHIGPFKNADELMKHIESLPEEDDNE